ncbi:hypothetical protein ACLOJK_013020 [Asimina triloba]
MAFCSRIGSLVRQSISTNGLSNGPIPVMPLLNSVRYVSTKLFVGGLSYSTDDQSLRDAFINFGDVVEARVITDRDSGRSRGFGFVNFDSDEAASSALSGMDGKAHFFGTLWMEDGCYKHFLGEKMMHVVDYYLVGDDECPEEHGKSIAQSVDQDVVLIIAFIKELHGRNIRVSYANERPSSPYRGSYGGSSGYGGGFGGGAGAE